MRGNQKNRGGRVVAYLMLLALWCNGSFAYDLKRGDYEFFDDDDNDAAVDAAARTVSTSVRLCISTLF